MSLNDLERAVIGSLIFQPQFLELTDLRAGDLSSARYRKTFEIISGLWESERGEISLPVLAERLGGENSAAFVGSLVDGLRHYSEAQFIRSVEELRWLRGTRELSRDLSHELALEQRTGLPDRAAWERIFERMENLRRSTSKQLGPGAVLRRLSEIEPRPVEWTWPNRIPRGKLSLIVGDPGLGKSFLCIDLAARISRGREWPDLRESAGLGSTLLLTAEDGLADTVRIRADSAGADVSKLIILEAVRINGESKLFSLDEHLNILENVIKENADLAMIVIDPLSAFLGDLDSHKNAEIRGALAPLSALAERANVSIVAVSHLNKSATTDKAVYRVSGSLSFVAAARACWGVMKDPDDPEQERRLFVPVKTNLSIKPTSLIFRISDGRLEYESKGVQLDADELLSARTEDREEQNFADSWLQDFLQSGPQEVKEIRREALKDGVSKSALYRAAKRLKLGRSASGFGKFRSSTWELKK